MDEAKQGTVRLQVQSVDFEDRTITFQVPKEEMNKRRWKAGYAEVDLSEISEVRFEKHAL